MADARQDVIDRLRLARTSRIGPVTYAQLVRRYGSAKSALDALPEIARRHGGRPVSAPSAQVIDAEISKTLALGATYLFSDDPDYPPLLRHLANAPVALIVKGDVALARRPTVAMVGARNASAAAIRFARHLAADLSRAGNVVVSGLARGIDTAAHNGALSGGTIGVIASGIDVAFPRENSSLQQEIGEKHLLVTEYAPGTEPLARQFPHRNRIIAGLSAGTVVVEAAPKSGSLLTARMAAEAGREVMAVPGSPLDPRAQGCNLLIREGATLVQCADDVMEAISAFDTRMVRQPVFAFDHRDVWPNDVAEPDDTSINALVELLGPIAVPVDELIQQSGLPPHHVQATLVEMEIAGRIERHAGGRVSLVC